MAISLDSSVHPVKTAVRARGKRAAKPRTQAGPPAMLIGNPALRPSPLDPGARRQMIAEAAYYRSAQRGFAPGCELDDWLAAEREVDERLCGEAHVF